MTNPTEIIPGVLFYSYLSTVRKDKVGFFEHNTLVLQVSGHFMLETATERISMNAGEMLLIRKNQLGEITKTPPEGGDYQTIVIILKEDLIREIALEQQIEMPGKYTGPANILLPENDFLHGYFQSVIPYVRHSGKHHGYPGYAESERRDPITAAYHARAQGIFIRLLRTA